MNFSFKKHAIWCILRIWIVFGFKQNLKLWEQFLLNIDFSSLAWTSSQLLATDKLLTYGVLSLKEWTLTTDIRLSVLLTSRQWRVWNLAAILPERLEMLGRLEGHILS